MSGAAWRARSVKVLENAPPGAADRGEVGGGLVDAEQTQAGGIGAPPSPFGGRGAGRVGDQSTQEPLGA